MPRFFLEVSYKGTAYAGFQAQHNANTIQAEIEKSLLVYFRKAIWLTGSSRTDAGVHALQNFFHFDYESIDEKGLEKAVYHLNAILPPDIVIQNIFVVGADDHCRFDAISRQYEYTIYHQKDPFMADRGFFYPYTLDIGLLNEAAGLILNNIDFSAFSKRNTQVKTFNCSIYESEWVSDQQVLVYRVKGNRFLRGMVKGLVGTMLKAGRKKMSMEEFRGIINAGDAALADFSVPAHGLKLVKVNFPDSLRSGKRI